MQTNCELAHVQLAVNKTVLDHLMFDRAQIVHFQLSSTTIYMYSS